MPKKVAVIVVHLHGFGVTHNCLLSLEACGAAGMDVVLVDNGSTDGSAAKLVAAHPLIKLLHSPHNSGFTGGNNLGMHYALKEGYEFVLLLNNDTFVSSGFLEPLLRYLDQNLEVAAVQPKIFFHHDRSKLWSAGSFYNKALGFTYTRGLNKQNKPAYDTTVQVDWISGCALLVRSSVLRQTGLFADNMFLYFEDADLSFRIRQAGYKLAFVPASLIYHIAGASGKKEGHKNTVQPFVYYYNLHNRIWFLKKYSAWYLLPTVVLANGFYIGALMGFFLLRGRIAKLKAVVNAIKDGFNGKIGEGEQLTSLAANAKERVGAF